MFLFGLDKYSGCYGNLYFPYILIMGETFVCLCSVLTCQSTIHVGMDNGKVKIDIFFCLSENIWNSFLQRCLLSSPVRFI